MTDTSHHNDDGLQAAEYVLGTLPEIERMAFALRLASDAALRQHVAYWEKQLSAFNGAVASANPPPALRGALHERLFGAEKKTGFLQSLGFWRSLSFATLAALALVLAVPIFNSNTAPSTAIAQLVGQQGTVQLAATYDAAHGIIRYNRLSDAAPTDRDFELWVIIGKDAPVSLGVIPPGQSGVIKIASALSPKMNGAVLAITDEPKGGSLTGKPTGAVLSTGKLTAI